MRVLLILLMFLSAQAFADSFVLKCQVVFKTIPWGGVYSETTSSSWFSPVHPGAQTVMEMGFEPYVVRTRILVTSEENGSQVIGSVDMWPLGQSKKTTGSEIEFHSPSDVPPTVKLKAIGFRQGTDAQGNATHFEDSATVVCQKN